MVDGRKRPSGEGESVDGDGDGGGMGSRQEQDGSEKVREGRADGDELDQGPGNRYNTAPWVPWAEQNMLVSVNGRRDRGVHGQPRTSRRSRPPHSTNIPPLQGRRAALESGFCSETPMVGGL